MKNIQLIFACIFIVNVSSAQTNVFPSSGKAGIGTIVPASQLEIAVPAIVGGESLMKMRVADAANDYLEITNATAGPGVFMPLIKGHVVSTYSSAFLLSGETDSINDISTFPVTIFDSRLTASKVNNRPLFGWTSYTTRYMTMLANGNLGIGTSTPAEKLSVNGNIRAKEIKVETANWPDYVFADEYQPVSLSELETYIKINKHLPEIPSAKEVEADGLNLGEMNAKLLKKIEEITLYLIQQDQDIKSLKAKLETLQKDRD